MTHRDRWWLRFMEEPDDSGGGSRGMQALDEPREGVKPEGEGEGEGKPEGEGTPEPEVKPAAFDPKEFAKEFGTVIAQEMGKRKEEDKPPITPEEAKKLLKVWEPDDVFLAKFDNIETKKEALAMLRDGLLTQFDTLSQHRLRELQSTLEEKFNPIMERIQAMDEQAREERFDKNFPPLAKPALRPLLHAVAKSLGDQGKQFNSEQELFAALASGMEAVIKETNPDFKLQPAGSTPAKGTVTGKIPVTTPGSGAGVARKGDVIPQKPRGLAVFDK